MTRAQLASKEQRRSLAYSYAVWILGLTILGGMIAIPDLSALSSTVSTLTGNSWLAPLIVGYSLIALWNSAMMARCPCCRRTLNGPIAIATDRCARCGAVVVDDSAPKKRSK